MTQPRRPRRPRRTAPTLPDLQQLLTPTMYEEWGSIASPLPPQITEPGEAAAMAGLDWEPHFEPQYRRRRAGGSDERPRWEYFEAVDEDSGKPLFKYVTKGPGGRVLDSANRTYTTFANLECFQVAQAIGTAGGQLGKPVTFVAAGEINHGKKIFLMADMGTYELPGDPSPHTKYLGLLNGHDGSAALKVIGTDNRWACTNMIHAAEMDARQKGHAFSFRHTSKIAQRVHDAEQAIIAALHQMDLVARVSRQLIEQKTSAMQRNAYIEQFALAKIVGRGNPYRANEAEGSYQRENALAGITTKLSTILGSQTCTGINGTAYGLLAATVEYLDHHRPSTGPDSLFSRQMMVMDRDKRLALGVLHDIMRHN